jgi:P4 family phage/plasmid primase-like protien
VHPGSIGTDEPLVTSVDTSAALHTHALGPPSARPARQRGDGGCRARGWALVYASLGWRVFPVVPGEKRPMYPGWQRDATTDPGVIARYWRTEPAPNIGLICGEAFVAFDIEADHLPALRNWTRMDGHRLPATPVARTGRWGAGSNGKTVFLAIVRAITGGYATNTPFATFEQTSRTGIPNDLAALAGRRIVTASEINEGTRLNEARLKALTGGDPITARFLHGEFFDFQPVLKLWLAVNHKPVVKDDSHGFWRRVRLIPFTRRFTSDADPGLTEHLRTELPGILAWAVQGAVDWQRDGLEAPDTVSAATETYRAESDPLADFLDDCTVSGTGLEAGAGSLYSAYRAWADGASLREREVLTSTAFGSRLTGRYLKEKRKRGWVYLGIGLRAEHADAPPAVPGR